MKYLDNIPEDVIPSLNIPTGVPLVYNLDENLKPIKSPLAIAPLSVSMLPCVSAAVCCVLCVVCVCPCWLLTAVYPEEAYLCVTVNACYVL